MAKNPSKFMVLMWKVGGFLDGCAIDGGCDLGSKRLDWEDRDSG